MKAAYNDRGKDSVGGGVVGRFGGFGELVRYSSGELGGLAAAVEIGSRAKAAS